jgi:hypothetical protein
VLEHLGERIERRSDDPVMRAGVFRRKQQEHQRQCQAG